MPGGSWLTRQLTNFRIKTGAKGRRRARKPTTLPFLHTIQTSRFTLFHRAALLLALSGRPTLRLTKNPATRRRYTKLECALARAA